MANLTAVKHVYGVGPVLEERVHRETVHRERVHR